MTRRERIEARIEKRRQWAESRTRKADQEHARAMAVPLPPFGEPIKIGHHSERRHRAAFEKVDAAMGRMVENLDMAKHHESKAEGLESQLGSIFSDDSDAVEALESRIAEREAERDRIKAYNASCRKSAKSGEKFGNLDLLDDGQRRKIQSIAQHCPYQLGRGGSYPSYSLQNLGARIKADKDRLENIKRQNERKAKSEQSGGVLVERFAHCNWCQVTFAERPSADKLEALRSAGYSYSRGTWRGPLDKLPAGIDPQA